MLKSSAGPLMASARHFGFVIPNCSIRAATGGGSGLPGMASTISVSLPAVSGTMPCPGSGDALSPLPAKMPALVRQASPSPLPMMRPASSSRRRARPDAAWLSPVRPAAPFAVR